MTDSPGGPTPSSSPDRTEGPPSSRSPDAIEREGAVAGKIGTAIFLIVVVIVVLGAAVATYAPNALPTYHETPSCTATISAAPPSGSAPLSVDFSATITGGTTLSVTWTFGTGTNPANVTHVTSPVWTFKSPGHYPVQLSVSQEQTTGCEASTVVTVT